MANKEEAIRETIESNESSSQDRSGSEKKKLKKEIESNQQLIDGSNTGTQLEEGCHQTEETEDKESDARLQTADDKSVKSKKKKKLKSKSEQKSEDICGEDKQIKALELSSTLVALLDAKDGTNCLKIVRQVDDSNNFTIDVNAEEWKALTQLVSTVNKFFASNDDNNNQI